MQRLRTTFKRSRTPTGSEMKTQSSLEVPKQVRSASFDEIQLEAKRQLVTQQSTDNTGLLRVPQFSHRSKSVDSGTTAPEEPSNFLEVPRRFQRRRSSGMKSGVCIHCVCLEEYLREEAGRRPSSQDSCKSSFSFSETSSSEDEPSAKIMPCNITVTLSPDAPDPIPSFTLNSPPPQTDIPFVVSFEPTYDTSASCPLYPPPLAIEGSDDDVPTTPTRRRSIQRQEAFFAEPTGFSLENVSDVTSDCTDRTSDSALSETTPDLIVRDIYLTVPDLKRDRAASVDSCFSKVSQGKTEELQHSSLEVPVSPNVTLRSRSVDIVLPTDEQARYKALAMSTAAGDAVASGSRAVRVGKPNETTDGQARIRTTPDWSEAAVHGDHLWAPTSTSGDFCYVGDADCTKHGPRMKCPACNVVVHFNCINVLMEKMKFHCKPTFRDVGVRQYREQALVQHHWVHRRTEKGKCKQCGKSFQSKLSFSSKEIIAISCSWCKQAYHNKETCFNMQKISEECHLGHHRSIVVPPSWIVKLPRSGSFKSSLRKSPKKKTGSKRRNKEKDQKDQKTFVIKPIPTLDVRPVIVFINPKSGGNQGTKLLQKFQWLLNPRQVFDLTQGGPKAGLELFRKVPNLRILACGGDGTVGWVLSILDQISFSPPPAVGVLPLGTGNDLARALGWGGGYTDEPISKILANIGESETVLLDRWELKVEKNGNATNCDDGKDNLPLNVVNNYYSLGVDAHIALEFHEAREAHPEKFNSRLRNKMFYGQAGGKDLVKRKWKALADFVTLECDGKDLTPKLKELRVHAIVFLNIPSYGGGTHPWNRSGGAHEPATDDGLIEVVGLTTYQLPLLQAGGHGTCIAQCKSAKIVTSKTIPMQVDGEACKLKPSVIELQLLNKATMLAKRKGALKQVAPPSLEPVKMDVLLINMSDYEQNNHDKDLLAQTALNLGSIEADPCTDLENIRKKIATLCENHPDQPKLIDWVFVDSCTAERFFRVDKAQETIHYVTDIAVDALYILDMGADTSATPSALGSTDDSTDQSMRQFSVPEMRVSSSESLDSPSQKAQSQSIESNDSVAFGSPRAKQYGQEAGAREETTLKNTLASINGKIERTLENSTYLKSNLLEKTSDGILKAAKLGDIQMLKDLHTQGYSLLSIDSQGQTALHYGSRYGHKDVVKYLITFAPQSIMNMVDNDKGQTALHKAAACKRRSICCLLVAGGAKLNIRDYRGCTPRMLAAEAEDDDLVAYLESQEHFQLVTEDDAPTDV